VFEVLPVNHRLEYLFFFQSHKTTFVFF
jgi:hypothetical protein